MSTDTILLTFPHQPRRARRRRAAGGPVLAGLALAAVGVYVHADTDWPSFGGAVGGGHYSPADQITPGNVEGLEKAWEWRSGDFRGFGTSEVEIVPGEPESTISSAWQMTPILVDGTLYGCTPFNRVFALDPATGTPKWIFDPGVATETEFLLNCRGVASWKSDAPTGKRCEHRILSGTMDARLIAVDANDGKPCEDFGDGGEIDLKKGLGEATASDYSIISPPAIAGDRVITGSMHMDRQHNDLPSGVVRAYDVRTGELVWYWDAVPPGTPPAFDDEGNPRYHRGTSNVWSIMSVDEQRGLVFLPTGNTSTDFFGGYREDIDHYSSSVVALDASTGEVVWHFQTVHHDVWDYDTPSQPTLFDLERDGKRIPALAQPTKMGHLFVLNRENGEPLFPVEERPVPQVGNVPEDYLAPTQPFPVVPAPLHPPGLTVDDAWGFTFWDRRACEKKIAGLLNEGIFTPPSIQGSVFYPSDYGGNNWGSPAIDPERGVIVLANLFMPAALKLVPREACNAKDDPVVWPQRDTPYCIRVEPLLSPLGAPCVEPPWSTLVALDYATGEKRWEVPLGTVGGMAPWPFSRIKGGPIAGGPSVTAGGLVFVAASSDEHLRAYDTTTGEELWKAKLPTGGHAVPMSYEIDGRQYVVIAAGGHYGMPHEAPGDWLIAFALPE